MGRDRQKLISITRTDCRWDYYKGSGSGGQKKNKTENCVRCTHKESKAVGKSEEGKSKQQNKVRAFKRMSDTKEFKKWLKMECARKSGVLDEIKHKVEHEMRYNVRVEGKVDGKWSKLDELVKK